MQGLRPTKHRANRPVGHGDPGFRHTLQLVQECEALWPSSIESSTFLTASATLSRFYPKYLIGHRSYVPLMLLVIQCTQCHVSQSIELYPISWVPLSLQLLPAVRLTREIYKRRLIIIVVVNQIHLVIPQVYRG